MAKWEVPEWVTKRKDIVLSDHGCVAKRKTEADWMDVVGSTVFEKGIHEFAILAEGCYVRIGVISERCVAQDVNPRDSGDKKVILGWARGANTWTKGTFKEGMFENTSIPQLHRSHVEFQLDMESRCLAARNHGDTDWIPLEEGLPDAVRPWASLGSQGKQVRLICGLAGEEGINAATLHADLSRDLGAMFDAGEMTDITILSRGTRLEAHKIILAARSKVFAAMLRAPMKESNTAEIVLDDLEPQTLQHMLRFLYTGDVPKDILQGEATSMSLLQVAHRFELPKLEQMCIQKLRDGLQLDTVSTVLQEADAMSLSGLRKACLDYIAKNIHEIQSATSFKSLAEKRPALMLDVVAAIAPPKKKRRESA